MYEKKLQRKRKTIGKKMKIDQNEKWTSKKLKMKNMYMITVLEQKWSDNYCNSRKLKKKENESQKNEKKILKE